MRHAGIIFTFIALAVIFAFFGWAFYATRDLGSWTGGSGAIAIMIILGVLGTGGLTAGLMWLAFYSSRKGYDEAAYRGNADEEWRER
jgi:hypothetical protein